MTSPIISSSLLGSLMDHQHKSTSRPGRTSSYLLCLFLLISSILAVLNIAGFQQHKQQLPPRRGVFRHGNTEYRYNDPLVAEKGQKCSICLDDFREHDLLTQMPDCHHVYHAICFNSWYKRSKRCPLCNIKRGGRWSWTVDRLTADKIRVDNQFLQDLKIEQAPETAIAEDDEEPTIMRVNSMEMRRRCRMNSI